MVFGVQDEIIGMEAAKQVYERIASKDKNLLIDQEWGHFANYEETRWQVLADQVATFILKNS